MSSECVDFRYLVKTVVNSMYSQLQQSSSNQLTAFWQYKMVNQPKTQIQPAFAQFLKYKANNL